MLGAALAALALGAASAWAARRFVDAPGKGLAGVLIGLQAILTVWALAVSPTATAAVASILLAAALLILVVTDLTALRLPDLITLPLIAAGLAVAHLEGRMITDHLWGALLGWAWLAALAAGFHKLTGRRGVGMGDAKLLAAAGAWCGWTALPGLVMIACVAALLWIALRVWRNGRASAGEPLPFGVTLALAFWLVRLHGLPTDVL